VRQYLKKDSSFVVDGNGRVSLYNDRFRLSKSCETATCLLAIANADTGRGKRSSMFEVLAIIVVVVIPGG
jgi:hypothetical protein